MGLHVHLHAVSLEMTCLGEVCANVGDDETL